MSKVFMGEETPLKHYSVVAIGGGPAGIAVAIEAMQAGIAAADILVLEKGPGSIEAIKRFYPEKKMTLANYKGLPTNTEGHLQVFPDLTKAETVVYFDELIAKYQVPIRFNSEVFKIAREGSRFILYFNGERITADHIAIGIGILGRPNKPSYKIPSSLRDRVHFDLTTKKIEKLKVLIVGGGDTSSEYAQVLVQENCHVTLAYRGKELSRMMKTNREALDELLADGKVRVQLECEIHEIADEAGAPKAVFLDAARHAHELFDAVVYAIGGTTPLNFLKTLGVSCDANWPIVGASGETNIPGVYLVGDLVAGKQGGSILTAYNSAYRSIQHIAAALKQPRASEG